MRWDGRNPLRRRHSLLNQTPRNLAADRTDLPFEITNAGLASVVFNDRFQPFIGEDDLLFLQPVVCSLFFDQVALGDLHLLALGITGEPDDLQTVLQSMRDRVQDIRGRDEHDLRKIVLDIEVMVVECVVLLGIQNFQQRRRRIAAKIVSELVNLIEQYERIDDAGLLHHLNDLPRQRADIGAAMAANFGLVAHSSQ